MMKATCQVRPGLTVEVSAETQPALWDEIARAQEVFGERSCALCHGTELLPIRRERAVKGRGKVTFREWRCLNPECGATLSVGITQDQRHLFPIRQLTEKGKASRAEGRYGEHNGWTTFRGEHDVDDGEGAPDPQPAKRTDKPAAATSGTPAAQPAQRKPTETTVAQSPGYKAPTREEAGAPISSQQWTKLQEVLKSRHILLAAFLERFGYKRGSDIKAKDFQERLQAAENPDAELLRLNKSMPARPGGR